MHVLELLHQHTNNCDFVTFFLKLFFTTTANVRSFAREHFHSSCAATPTLHAGTLTETHQFWQQLVNTAMLSINNRNFILTY